MLLKDFYSVIDNEQVADNKYIFTIKLNKDHDIFKGHFPDNPVTPGVCMMQIIKELTQNVTGKNLILKTTSNVKFMAIINPVTHPNLKLELDIVIGDEIKVKNTTSFEETVALKLSNTYTIL